MSFHALLQGIFPTWGSNLGLLNYGQIPHHLSRDKNKDLIHLKTIRKASEERCCVQCHLKDEREIVLDQKEEGAERCAQVNILEIGKNLT